MTPDTPAYAEMSKLFTDCNVSNYLSDTYHGYYKIDTPKHIDYCFANGITPISREIINAEFDGKFPSDHYGLFIKLDI